MPSHTTPPSDRPPPRPASTAPRKPAPAPPPHTHTTRPPPPAQVVFYAGDYVRQMEDVQRGNLDAAVVTSGFLEAHYPDLLAAGTFRFHLLQAPEQRRAARPPAPRQLSSV